MGTAIETTALKRRFGEKWAVNGVDLQVPERSVYGFLGENGAGKTTTIRMLLGLLKPTAGTVRIFGYDVARQRCESARLVGSLVEIPSHYDHLTGRENLDITRRLLGLPRADVDHVLEVVDLVADAERRVGGYSLGMRQRLGVARALLGQPKLLILDEPTNGLDPNGIREMRLLIGGLPEREAVTVLVSSHVLAEVDLFATHLGLMHRGKLLMSGPIGDLKARQRRTLRIEAHNPDAAMSVLAANGVYAERQGAALLVADAGGAIDPARLNSLLVGRGVAVSGLSLSGPTLEDIFVSLVEDADEIPSVTAKAA